MSSLKELNEKLNLNIRGYRELNNVKIIDTDSGKFVIKKNTADDNLYNYLTSKNFNYILSKKKIDNYDLFPYVDEISMPDDEKAIELVYILSLLHNKTTFYKEVVLDKTKETYESLNNEIDYLGRYYYELQDMIEQKIYMSPGEYLLIRNISLIYSALQYAKANLDKWYEIKKTQKKERVVLLHNKPSLEHILIGNTSQLISWNNYKRDIPIYDFIYFYKKDYLKLEMSTLFDIYQSKFMYTDDEMLLFLSIISIPKKITFSDTNYNNCYKIYELIRYMEMTRDFVLKENEKRKKENEDEFYE